MSLASRRQGFLTATTVGTDFVGKVGGERDVDDLGCVLALNTIDQAPLPKVASRPRSFLRISKSNGHCGTGVSCDKSSFVVLRLSWLDGRRVSCFGVTKEGGADDLLSHGDDGGVMAEAGTDPWLN